MTTAHALLQPLVALLIWSLLMWLWMYITRLPAMQKMQLKLDPNVPPRDLMSVFPATVRWKADNYNHLLEAPTLFYAAVLAMALVDPGNSIALGAAWAYVLLRVAHSLVQSLINHIPTRFGLFVLSTLALTVIVWQLAVRVFAG